MAIGSTSIANRQFLVAFLVIPMHLHHCGVPTSFDLSGLLLGLSYRCGVHGFHTADLRLVGVTLQVVGQQEPRDEDTDGDIYPSSQRHHPSPREPADPPALLPVGV